MSTPNNKPTRGQQFQSLINTALQNGPYSFKHGSIQGMNRDQQLKFHFIWCTGILTALLAYSAVDLMEVRARLTQIAQGNDDDNNEHTS